MFLQIILAIFCGCLAGIFTGLIPGVHINLVSLLLVSISGYMLGFTSPLILAVFIIAMSVTHTFLDSIPSVFLGAPDPDQALNVLPGHRLLLQGKGYEAVKLTVIGSLLSLILVLILMPFLLPFVPGIYLFVKPYMAYILIAVVVFMIIKEGSLKGIMLGTIVFLLSGVLGIIVLGFPNLNQPLFPLLSGLFGVSVLLMSLNDKVNVPKQEISETIVVSPVHKAKAIGAAVFAGSLTGIFPGLGAAQAAIIGMQLVGDIGEYAFMILVGGINTVNFVFSLATFYTLQKARNGAIVAVLEIVKSISLVELIVLLCTALIAGGAATYLAFKITRVFSRMISKVNYRLICITIICFITVLAFVFSGFLGLLVLLTSTAVGFLSPLFGVKRSLAMGCLLLPVIFYFLI